MLHNYLKTAWRSLMQHKPLTALNVAGLTMGMTAAVLIFLWVQNELSFDRFEPGADRIYSVSTRLTAPSWAWEGAPMLMAAAIQKEVPDHRGGKRFLFQEPAREGGSVGRV
jgi:putative ABC transport system permease protein